MKNILFLLFTTLMLISCGDGTTATETTTTTDSTATTETPITEPTKEEPATGLSMDALQGVYAKGGHDESWMLIVGIQGGIPMATMVKIPGMLPPIEVLQSEAGPEGAEVIPLPQFNVDLANGTFTSDKGAGTANGSMISFADLKDEAGDPLVLDRNDEYTFSMTK